jgi:predicted amidohydrolase
VSSRVVVAVAQLEVEEHAVDANVARCHRAVVDASARGAGLVVLPECAMTGYRYDCREEVCAAALAPTDARLAGLADAAVALGVTVVVGYLERAGDALHNTVAVLGADGRTHRVRKTHLPQLGADRFVVAGDRLGELVDTPAGRIGVAVCYDFRFPEVTRSLALAGAEVVVVPVNWSAEVAVLAEHVVAARAVENRVFVAVADRTGTVGGVEHLGESQVVDPSGVRLTAPLDPATPVAIATAALDLEQARTKATVFDAGTFEIDVFADRRPELYGALAQEQCDDA